MTRRLKAYVHVHMPDGQTVVVGPDDTVPDELAALITNPGAWVGEAAEPDRAPPSPGAENAVDDADEDQAADDQESGGDEPQDPDSADHLPVPPRSGAGSGAAAWAVYARASGLDVPADAGRADIIAALTAAGLPVE